MGKTVLFIDRNSIIKRSVLNGNIDPDRIIPFVYTAQCKYVLILLGSVLYEKLQNDITNNTLTGAYKELVDNYITDCLVHYSLVEALPFMAYNIANGGIQKHVSENAEAPSKSEIDFLLSKELQTAQFFAERLVKYLIAHNADYPEYTQSTGFSDTIFPEKSSAYSTGWNLN